MIRCTARHGALLPMVLVAMVVIALAACAALFVARQERRSTWNTRLQTTALGEADAAQAEVATLLSGVAHTLAVGSSMSRSSPAPAGVARTTLTRLGPTLFALVTDATMRSAQGLFARRRVSLLLRLDAAPVDMPAALSVTGGDAVPQALADGADRAPPGWPCDSTRADTAAVRHPSPAPDTAALGALRSRAAIRLPAGTALSLVRPALRDGVCDTGRSDNWGDPTRMGACESWLPIVHAAGDLSIDGGSGQGVLVVDGDLSVGGGFQFTGAVIVHGTVAVGGGGASFSGGVIANGLIADVRSDGGPSVVHRSSCAVGAALLAAGALLPVSERAWASVR
jgi:hypothetical protein